MAGSKFWIAAFVAMLVTVSFSSAIAQRPNQGPGEGNGPPPNLNGRPETRRPRANNVPQGTEQFLDQEYVVDGHQRQRLDLFVPQSEEPVPIVVWIHGGAWLAGDKANPPALFLLEKRYAVASVNYRLSQHAVFPAQIEDCKAAIRFLRANARKFNIDTDHIGVWGSSAGGHLVALLGTSGDIKGLEGDLGNAKESSRVQCVVDFYGPTDFTVMGGSHDRPDSPESKLIGGAVPQHHDKAAQANPITYVTRDDTPFLIFHGDKDATVPFNQSELLNAALKDAGVESTLVTMSGSGHGGPAFYAPETRRTIEQFFDRHLKGSTPRELQSAPEIQSSSSRVP